MSADIALSGSVYDPNNKPLPGVIVSLAQGKLSTVTDNNGGWSLGGAASGIEKRNLRSGPSNNLVLENGHLRVRLSGFEANGRGLRSQPAVVVDQSNVSARTFAVQDTLLYSLGGQVCLRDTVTGSQSGIVRKLDTTWNESIIYGYLKDARDGQQYRTVTIGTQTWMAENLNYKVDSSWWRDNIAENGAKYGRLYKWAAAMGLNDSCDTASCASQVAATHRGACPGGWHVPSADEWRKLTDTTLQDTTAGAKLRANSSQWYINTGTDDYGFSVLPAGQRYAEGRFVDLGSRAYFWSASGNNDTGAWYWYFIGGYAKASRSLYLKKYGYSLRCLMD